MIRTRRLTLRRVAARDWQAIQAIWADAAQSEYARYDRPNDTSSAAVAARIAKWASFAESEEHIFWAVCRTGSVIGYISLHRRENGYELGYCFHSRWHGKGYARESVAAALAHLQTLGASRAVAGTALDNLPSVRLLTALGFVQVGTEPVSFYRDAEGKDIVFTGGIFARELAAQTPLER